MKKLMIISLVLATLAGCSTNTVDQHMVGVGKMGDVSIVDMRSAVVNNLLLAQSTFHNSGSKPVTGYYRCQFFDANKMQLGAAQIWEPVTIYPNEDQAVKCAATQTEATDFKVEFSTDGKNVSIYQYK